MEFLEAKRIINEYDSALAKGTVGDTILRYKSWLPYTKAKIKFAYFVIIEEEISKNGKLAADFRDKITEDYKQLSNFVPDSIADNFAKKQEIWLDKKNDPVESQKYKSSIREYIAYTHFIQNDNLFDEMNDFIEEFSG